MALRGVLVEPVRAQALCDIGNAHGRLWERQAPPCHVGCDRAGGAGGVLPKKARGALAPCEARDAEVDRFGDLQPRAAGARARALVALRGVLVEPVRAQAVLDAADNGRGPWKLQKIPVHVDGKGARHACAAVVAEKRALARAAGLGLKPRTRGKAEGLHRGDGAPVTRAARVRARGASVLKAVLGAKVPRRALCANADTGVRMHAVVPCVAHAYTPLACRVR